MTRDNSPPDATVESGRSVSPGLAEKNSSASSVPRALQRASSRLVWSRSSNRPLAIARSSTSAFEGRRQCPRPPSPLGGQRFRSLQIGIARRLERQGQRRTLGSVIPRTIEFGHNRASALQNDIQVAAILLRQALDVGKSRLDLGQTVGRGIDVGGARAQGPSQIIEGRVDGGPCLQIGSEGGVESRQFFYMTPDRGEYRDDRVILLVERAIGAAGECVDPLGVRQPPPFGQELPIPRPTAVRLDRSRPMQR